MAYPGRGGWSGGGWGGWNGGGTTNLASGTPPTSPTTSRNTPVDPPAPSTPPPTPPSYTPPSPDQPATSPTTNPSPNTSGQNSDGGSNIGSPPSDSILSRVLSANPSIAQSVTRTTLTLDSSVVVVMGIYTDNSMSTIYISQTSVANNAQAGPTETPNTASSLSSERRSFHPGTIVGALVGGIIAAILASWAVWWFWKRKRRARVSEAIPYHPHQPEFRSYTPSLTTHIISSTSHILSSIGHISPSSDSSVPSPAYSNIANDFLVSQPASSPNEKGQIRNTDIVTEQPQRPDLPQLVIPSNDTHNHSRTPSRSSFRTEATGPPQYTSIFTSQPTPNFRLSQMVSPLYTPQDMEPAMLAAWTKRTQPYDVERGGTCTGRF